VNRNDRPGMRKNIRKLLIASFKLMLVVIGMLYFYPILGVLTYEPIITLCRVPEEGNLLGVIVGHGTHVLSILVVAFLAGLLFPKDGWIVRSAAMISVSWFLVYDIIAGVYLSRDFPDFPVFSFFQSSITPYIFVIVLGYWLSGSFHHCGAALRTRPGAEHNQS